MARTSLKVNGKSHTVDVDADCPLLYVLRDNLALNNPRFGCGLGQCGACTVLVDNRAVRSCLLPVSRAAGKEIVTLEGLGSPENPASGPASIHRRAGFSVRLLPQRLGADGKSAARHESSSHGSGNAARVRKFGLPLRQPRADSRRGPQGGRFQEGGRISHAG